MSAFPAGSSRGEPAPATNTGSARPAARLRVGVVGARQAVQGIGAYVAREFARAGCDVVGIVGTRQETVAAARADLAQRFGLQCEGYTDLPALLARQRPDIIALCSPAGCHRAQLQAALAAGAHVFCEKPLWWEPGTLERPAAELVAQVTALAAGFAEAGRLLALNTQWPFTLECFGRLHPGVLAGPPPWPVRRFEMLLSPIRSGQDMVVDGAPHLISMLAALLGPGRARDIRATWNGAGEGSAGPSAGGGTSLDLALGYEHARGTTQVLLRLRQCPQQPRPAGYGIDGAWAERQVSQPGYRMALAGAGRSEALHDPLDLCVAAFVAAVARGEATDGQTLVESLAILRDLVAAAGGPDRFRDVREVPA